MRYRFWSTQDDGLTWYAGARFDDQYTTRGDPK